MPRPAIFLLLVLWVAPTAWGQTVWRDEFEGPETSLREAGSDAPFKVEFHDRVTGEAHAGRSSERISVRGQHGSYVHFSRAIPPGRVISELMPSVWIKSDRSGMQLLARVVLPRSIDTERGKPLTTLLRGSGYTQAGGWQQLRMENLPRLLEQQVRLLRAELKREIDLREAYVDMVLLNVYGGPDLTNVWVDDLEVAGIVSPQGGQLATQADAGPRSPAGIQALPATWANGEGVPPVELRGTLLFVGGWPFFPRAIDYRGEPIPRLKAMGFNTLRLEQVPRPELLREAARAGMWLVAPPPSAAELEARAAGGADAKIGSEFDPVLAWNLGSGLASRQLEATRQWSRLVAAADPRSRPILCEAESDLRSYTRPPVNLFLARRSPLGTTLSLGSYGDWLRERAQLVLPGTPLWTTIQTAPSERLLEQAELLATVPRAQMVLDEAQLRLLVCSALAGGARGLCFESASRLDAEDAATRRRAALLEWMNLTLDLIEPWPSSGRFVAPADSSDPQATGAVLETDRSRLVMPIYAPHYGQCAPGNPVVKPLVLKAPGVPEGYKAFELSPVFLRPLTSRRLAGGTQVALAEVERDSLVVFTQDEAVIHTLRQTIAKIDRRGAQLAREIAAAQVADALAADDRLSEVGRAVPATKTLRTTAESDLKQCDALLGKKDLAAAYERARHAMQVAREIGRAHWEKAASGADWPLSDPLVAQVATLADHYRLMHDLGSLPRFANRLPAGDFEDLNGMLQTGWRYYQYQLPEIATSVELAAEAAKTGRTGLRLRSTPANPDAKVGAVETPPLWVTSPAIPVEAGQIVEIQGWLRIRQPIAGSVDGLLILDSLTGDALAQRITTAPKWKQFTLYRAVPRAGSLSITFALAGIGEVWIDDVTVQVIQRSPAAPSRQALAFPNPAGR